MGTGNKMQIPGEDSLQGMLSIAFWHHGTRTHHFLLFNQQPVRQATLLPCWIQKKPINCHEQAFETNSRSPQMPKPTLPVTEGCATCSSPSGSSQEEFSLWQLQPEIVVVLIPLPKS